jgi:hypothetical protein
MKKELHKMEKELQKMKKRAPQDEKKELHKLEKKTFWGMCMGSFSSFGACRQTEPLGLRR